ncbi:MAG: hypothetical protein ABIP33_06430 [Pseudolysinimonas sp.]
MPDALTSAYQRELRRTRDKVGDAVAAHWLSLGTYNEADVPRFVAKIAPVVVAGQSRAIALSSAYSAKKLGIKPIGVSAAAVIPKLRNSVPLAEVYRRPFVKVWTDLGGGDDLEYAIQTGGDQARSTSLMDVALATMAAYVAFASQLNGALDEGAGGEIVAWRRVADASCCEYCSMLDGVHTGPSQPQPLHNRCGCTAEPITRSASPGSFAQFAGPGATFDDAEIHEHGELGPVIGKAGDSFTGPSQINPKDYGTFDDFAAARAAERGHAAAA